MIHYNLIHWNVFKGQGQWHTVGRANGAAVVSATFDTWAEALDYVVRYW